MHVLAPLPSPENEPGSASWTMSDHWQEPSHPSRALSQGQWMPSNLGLPGGLGGGARDSAVAKAPAVQTPALGPPSAPTLRFLLSPRPPPGQLSSSRGPCRLLRVTGQREGRCPGRAARVLGLHAVCGYQSKLIYMRVRWPFPQGGFQSAGVLLAVRGHRRGLQW